MKNSRLSQRFSDEFSFACFAEGFRAFEAYQKAHNVRDLQTAVAAFEKAVREYPQDRIHHYHLGLVRLEQTAALPDADLPAQTGDASAIKASVDAYVSRSKPVNNIRLGLIDEAIREFETYQLNRALRPEDIKEEAKYNGNRDIGSDLWLYFWTDYNRAASYVHRLDVDGYLCGRAIIKTYLPDVVLLPTRAAVRKDLGKIPEPTTVAAGMLSRQPLQSPSMAPGSFDDQDSSNTSAHQLRENAEILSKMPKIAHGERDTFLFRLRSLYVLTRARPLREPFSLLEPNKSKLKLEEIDLVFAAIKTLGDQIDAAYGHSSQKKKPDLTCKRELESDLLNQRGHLHCARVLALASPDELNDATEPDKGGDSRAAFACLVERLTQGKHRAKAVLELQNAASSFEHSLLKQPGWIPALKNLREIYLLQNRFEEASRIQLPILPGPGLKTQTNPQSTTTGWFDLWRPVD